MFSDENYWFSNRNKSFYNNFIAFLKNVKFYSQQVEVEKVDSKNFYISVFDETNYVSFYIYENDIIEIVDDADRCYYYCDNVYKKFIETFETFFNENQKYCRSAVTPIREWYEYAVYDRNHNVLESDYSIKTPYLYYNSGIVHLCGQAGTGSLARWARFFDVENGLISPNYYGQTDFFGDMVSATDSSRVVVYEMFSGKQICVFNQFEKPLCDCTENIQSAYFSEDGTQLVVKYMNSKYEIETQAFNI